MTFCKVDFFLESKSPCLSEEHVYLMTHLDEVSRMTSLSDVTSAAVTFVSFRLRQAQRWIIRQERFLGKAWLMGTLLDVAADSHLES